LSTIMCGAPSETIEKALRTRPAAGGG